MAEAHGETDRGTHNRGRLLLVDDDPQHRRLYGRRLERKGYTVSTCESADEAIAWVHEDVPDAVLLDIAMPGRDGLSALQEFISIAPALPVIIHTAYPTFRDNFLSWSAEAYIEKSADLTPLLVAIDQVLRPDAPDAIASGQACTA